MQRAVVLRVGVTFEQIENEHLRNLLVFRVWIIWTGTKNWGGAAQRGYRPALAALYFRSLAAYNALGVLGDITPQSFCADFRSCLVARSRKSIKCVLKTLRSWEDPCMQYQFVSKKQTVHPAVPNSDTLVDASVTAYPNVVQLLTYGLLYKTWQIEGHFQ